MGNTEIGSLCEYFTDIDNENRDTKETIGHTGKHRYEKLQRICQE